MFPWSSGEPLFFHPRLEVPIFRGTFIADVDGPLCGNVGEGLPTSSCGYWPLVSPFLGRQENSHGGGRACSSDVHQMFIPKKNREKDAGLAANEVLMEVQLAVWACHCEASQRWALAYADGFKPFKTQVCFLRCSILWEEWTWICSSYFDVNQGFVRVSFWAISYRDPRIASLFFRLQDAADFVNFLGTMVFSEKLKKDSALCWWCSKFPKNPSHILPNLSAPYGSSVPSPLIHRGLWMLVSRSFRPRSQRINRWTSKTQGTDHKLGDSHMGWWFQKKDCPKSLAGHTSWCPVLIFETSAIGSFLAKWMIKQRAVRSSKFCSCSAKFASADSRTRCNRNAGMEERKDDLDGNWRLFCVINVSTYLTDSFKKEWIYRYWHIESFGFGTWKW